MKDGKKTVKTVRPFHLAPLADFLLTVFHHLILSTNKMQLSKQHWFAHISYQVFLLTSSGHDHILLLYLFSGCTFISSPGKHSQNAPQNDIRLFLLLVLLYCQYPFICDVFLFAATCISFIDSSFSIMGIILTI